MARQWQIPGGPYLNEDATRQWQIPGAGFVNETSAAGSTTMPADAGSFTLSGKDADLTASSDPLRADTALPFNVTGFAAGLIYGKKITAVTGSFVFSGAPSLSDHEHDVEKGAFSLTGVAAVLRFGHSLTAERGAFSFTGSEVVFIASPAKKLSAETGAFVMTGMDATLSRVATSMAAEKGTFTLTGGSIPGTLVFAADSGSFTLSGRDATLTFRGRTSWTRKGRDPSTVWNRKFP